ncbi:MAG: SIR2 family protein [Armatimonadetes bacterium]|nr:SIR2 family protein [Armatimonadota bacterium]
MKLVLLFGAGASHDCADDRMADVKEAFRPPLVGGLFGNTPEFGGLLAKYPGAEALAPDIRAALSDTIGIEALFAKYATHQNEIIRRLFIEVPFYLSDLLLEVSNSFVAHGATRYDQLLVQIEEANISDALLLTVNYDELIERAYRRLYRTDFPTVDSCLTANRNKPLIKLHGSVSWARMLAHQVGGGSIMEAIEKVEVPLAFDQSFLRIAPSDRKYWRQGSRFCYPAIAPPVQGKTDFRCPDTHLTLARRQLKEATHLIVVGFSGLDPHVVGLFSECEQLERAFFISLNSAEAQKTIDRFSQYCPDTFGKSSPVKLEAFDTTFARALRSRELSNFLGPS